MQTINLPINVPTLGLFQLENTSAKMNLSEVFSERKGSYLNEFTMFVAHFNAIPNCIQEEHIDCRKANQWFAQQFKAEIKDSYYNKRAFSKSKKVIYTNCKGSRKIFS